MMHKLQQKYGFWAAFSMTLTAVFGSSLLITFNYVTFLAEFDPIFMILAWIIGGLVILPSNLLMIEPATAFKTSGTAYSWLQRAKWKVIAFWFGWVLVILVSAGAVAQVSIGLGELISKLVDEAAGNKTSLATNPWIAKGIGVSILLVLALIQIFIKNSNKYTQYIFTVLTFMPIVFILIAAMVYGNLNNTFNYEAKNGINQSLKTTFLSSGLLIPAIALTGYGYSGTEISTYVTEEIKKPEKTIPWVIIAAIITIVTTYVIYALALLSLTPTTELNGQKNIPWNLNSLPQWAKITFQSLAIFLFVGSLNSFLVYQTALIYKLSQHRDFTHHFLKTNKHNVPYRAMIFLILLALGFILTSNLFDILSYFSIATSSLKIVVSSVTWYLRKKDREYKKIYNDQIFYTFLFFAYFTAGLTLAGSIMALFIFNPGSSGTIELITKIAALIILVGLMPLGYVKYHFMDYKQKQAIRQQLNLKTQKELKKLYFDNEERYRLATQEVNKLIDQEYQIYLKEKQFG